MLMLRQGERYLRSGSLSDAEKEFLAATKIFGEEKDEHSWAIGRGKIAETLRRRRDVDAALGICRTEQLPIFEKLGDHRQIAITKGHIAEILFDKEEYDEAVRISLEEELPVYRSLWDKRAEIVALQRVADIWFVIGLFDRASELLANDVMPLGNELGDVALYRKAKDTLSDIDNAQKDQSWRILQEKNSAEPVIDAHPYSQKNRFVQQFEFFRIAWPKA
jgi:hypothetical protein